MISFGRMDVAYFSNEYCSPLGENLPVRFNVFFFIYHIGTEGHIALDRRRTHRLACANIQRSHKFQNAQKNFEKWLCHFPTVYFRDIVLCALLCLCGEPYYSFSSFSIKCTKRNHLASKILLI